MLLTYQIFLVLSHHWARALPGQDMGMIFPFSFQWRTSWWRIDRALQSLCISHYPLFHMSLRTHLVRSLTPLMKLFMALTIINLCRSKICECLSVSFLHFSLLILGKPSWVLLSHIIWRKLLRTDLFFKRLIVLSHNKSFVWYVVWTNWGNRMSLYMVIEVFQVFVEDFASGLLWLSPNHNHLVLKVLNFPRENWLWFVFWHRYWLLTLLVNGYLIVQPYTKIKMRAYSVILQVFASFAE